MDNSLLNTQPRSKYNKKMLLSFAAIGLIGIIGIVALCSRPSITIQAEIIIADTSYDYEDPNTPLGCNADEIKITIQGIKGDICSPPCGIL